MTLFSGLALALLIGVALAGCGTQATNTINNHKVSSNASAPQVHCDSNAAPVCTRSVKVNGQTELVLVAPNGHTLYYYMPDTATTIACTGGCATTWPPLLAPTAIQAAGSQAHLTGITGTLSTLHRREGTQVVYNGHPLYTYATDSAPGDANGDGVLGKWHVATPALVPGNGPSGSGSGY